jgi:hypothetical protein
MRTIKRRRNKKKGKTVKGGRVNNKELHLIVRKPLLIKKDEDNDKMLYSWFLKRPSFYPHGIFDYANIQRKSIDEALSWIQIGEEPSRDIFGNEIKNMDTKIYEDEFEIGNYIGKSIREKIRIEETRKKKIIDEKAAEAEKQRMEKEKAAEAEKQRMEKEQTAEAEKQKMEKETNPDVINGAKRLDLTNGSYPMPSAEEGPKKYLEIPTLKKTQLAKDITKLLKDKYYIEYRNTYNPASKKYNGEKTRLVLLSEKFNDDKQRSEAWNNAIQYLKENNLLE